MPTYTCVEFTGHYPVGTAAVIRATSPEEAALMLNDELKKIGLPGDAEPAGMIPFGAMRNGLVRILRDGDY